MKEGDRLGLFTSGNACGQKENRRLGYLAEVFFVAGKRNHPHHDPEDKNTPTYELVGDRSRCVLVEPPLLIDEMIRQPNKRKDQHIGEARQNPYELDGMDATRLFNWVKDQRPELFLQLMGAIKGARRS